MAGKINREKMLSRINSIQTTSGQGLGYLERWANGESRKIRLLPPQSLLVFLKEGGKVYEADDLPWRDIYVHYGITSNSKERIFCPRAYQQLPCPVCEAIDELKATKKREDSELAVMMRLQRKYQYLALEREKQTEGPKFWEASKTTGNKIVGIFQDSDYGDITDVERGFDLTVKRVGSGVQDTEYQINPRRTPSPLYAKEDGSVDFETIFSWLDKIPNLAEPVKLFTYEQLEALLNGETSIRELRGYQPPTEVKEDDEETEVEDDEDDDEAEEVSPKAATPLKRFRK